MSKQVDERVVEMRFDNKQFESATKESMSTLDKLKQKLHLKDAAKGLDNLSNAVKKVDLSPIGKSTEMVTAKFSAMQVAGVTAMANLTNSAVNAGKNITKALTIEPVITGFQEYETQIGAIQTILANTQKEGTNVERVNAALDELNLYADQTIYNFTEMTRNIGTFTAAGVKLDDSVSAIKGIANLAAVSGSTSLQASTAMYQLSQALAAGKVSLMDWNSVVNAGMGGQVFQDALIRTSENLKTGAKQAIATYGTFRESLTKGEWLTKEVLTETLGQLAGAYSEADLLAKGYSEEQAKEIVKLAETAKGAATDVKTFTQLWDTLKEAVQSGWGQTWRTIIGDFDEAKERMTKLSTLFGSIIEKSSNRRNSMLSGALDSNWKQITDRLKKAGIETETFQNKIKELAKTHNVDLDKMIEKEGSFEKALKKAFSSGKLDKSILMDAIKSFVGGITDSANAAKNASKQMEKYNEIATKVIRGDFGNGAERVEKLTKAGYEYAAVQNIVNERLGSSVRHMSSLTDEQIQNADSLANLSDEQLKSKGYTEEQIIALRDLKKEADSAGSSIYKLINGFEKPSGVELAWGSVFNILDAITESCKAVKKAWTEIFHPGMTEDQIIAERSERLYKLLESIHAFTESLKVNEKTSQKITRTFKGLFAVLDLIRMVVGGALNIGFRILKEVLSAFDMDVLDLTANVGDAIVKFHDWVTEHNLLAKAIKFIIPYVKKAVSAVSEWIKNNETIQNGLKKLQSAFNDATKGIRKWIDGFKEADNIPKYIISGLVNGIKNGAGLAVEAIIELGKSILEGIKAVLGIHSPSTEFFEIGSNIIAGLINGLKEGMSSLLSFIGDIGQKCIDVISKIDFSKVFTLAISAGIIYSGKKIYDLAEKFSAPFEGLGKMFSGIGHMFNSAGKILDNFAGMIKVKKYEAIAKMFLNLGIAIGIMAASVYVLSNIEPAKLWTAVGAVAALGAVVVALSFAMSQMSGASASIGKDGVKISGMRTALLSLGIVLLLLATTVKMLGTLDPEQAKQGFLGLAGLVAAIGVVLLAFGTLVKGKSAQNIDKLGITLLKMSAAMLLMVVVIKLISGMSVGEITKGIACIVAFGGIMVGLVALTNLAGKKIDKVGGTLLKMSAAMLLMVVVIKLVASMSPSEIAKGVTCVVAFGGIMVGLVALTRLAGDKDIAKIGSTLLAMSAAMVLMALTVKLVSGMEPGEIAKGLVCIVAFGGIITGLVAATRLAGDGELKRVATTLLAMSISIGILAAISVLLGLVDIATLTKGITAVTILGGIMTAMIWATRGAENVKGNIIAMTVAIGIMAAAVAVLSFIDPSRLAGATTAMGILMGIFTVMIKVAGTAQAAIAPLIVMTAAVVILASIIRDLAELPIESALESVAALSALLLSMSISMAILSKAGLTVKDALVGAVGLLAMVVPLMAFVGVLAVMQGIKNAMSNAIILATFATVMTGLLVVLTGIGIIYMATMGIAATGIAGLLLMAVPLIAFVGVLAAMQGIQNAEANANILITLMTAMTTLLTTVSILGPLALIGVTAITAMSAVMVALAGLVVAVGALNEKFPQLETFLDSGIGLLSKLANGLGQVIGNFISGFAQGLTSGLPEVATNLSMFMMNLMPFIMGAKTIDESVLTNVKNLAGVILALTGAGILEGIASWLGGGDSLTKFGEKLIPFGKSIVAFSNTVKGIDEGAVTAAANAGKMMAEMAKTIPREGGWWSAIAGEKDMASFGAKLVAFGVAIKTFSTTLSTGDPINEAAITAAANAGKQMTEMASSMPKSGGLWQDIAGEQDIADFGKKIAAYGKSISKFASSMANMSLDNDAVKNAVKAGTEMTKLAEKLPREGGWWQAIAGKKDIESFGEKIVAFGKGIKNFAKEIKGVKIDNVNDATSALNGIIKMVKSVDGVDGSALSTFTSSLGNIGTTGVNNFIKAFSESGGKAAKAGKTLVDGVTKGVKDAMSSTDSSMKPIIDAMTKSVTSNQNKFVSAGKTMAKNFTKALKDGAKGAKTSFKEALDSAIKTVKGYKNKFTSAGKDLVTGFANGISKNTFKAEAKAKAMADKALKAAKKALDEHSPSKKFAKVGAFAVAGFANGITKNIGDATKASVKMANGVLDATQDALGIHSPSVVFDKQVGRYIVQGVAEGIKGDMSAEEAADKKAQNIVSAFQDAFDKYDRNISIRGKEFDLWSLNDGKTASDSEVIHKQLQVINDDLYDLNQKTKLAQDKYELLKSTFGADNKTTKEAYEALLDAQITAGNKAAELISTQDSLVTAEEQLLEQRISNNEKSNKLLELEQANGKLISDADKDRQYLSSYKYAWEAKIKEAANANKRYEKILAEYKDENHPKVLAALGELRDARIAEEEAESAYRDYEKSMYERDIQYIEDSISRREELNKRWEAMNGDTASDRQRFMYYKNQYDVDVINLQQIYQKKLRQYERFVLDLARQNNITIQEAKETKEAGKLWDEVLAADTDVKEAQNKVYKHRKEYYEQQKENLKNEYQLTSDIADLRYQIWEKTNGRKATDIEKDNMKLAFLTEQVGAQAKLVKMAEKAWKEASSEDSLAMEKEYLNAQLQLANLQSEVLDIQEENIKRQERAIERQRDAQDEYNNYIKKYEKYYLEHGMTREELEKDAKLVSGYDPSKVVSSAINKTNTAIDNVKTNVSNLTKAVGEGIQNGISDVTDNTASMLKTCADALNSEKDTWTKAGVAFVDGLIQGITSKKQSAVNTVADLVRTMLEAIQEVCENGMDYNPTITPVLDMSDVSAGASRLNSMLSGTTTYGLAKSIARKSNGNYDVYKAKLAEGNGPQNISFTQNNYSPKALSSIEIYRQTNNMISRIGKKVTQ